MDPSLTELMKYRHSSVKSFVYSHSPMGVIWGFSGVMKELAV